MLRCRRSSLPECHSSSRTRSPREGNRHSYREQEDDRGGNQTIAISWREIHSSEIQRRPMRRSFVSVSQYHDGEVLPGKTHDRIAKSDCLAGVPHVATAVMLADPPSKSVAHRGIVGRGGRNERLIETAALQPGDPVNEIVDRGVDAAVAEDGAGE